MAKRKRNKGPRRSHLKRWSSEMINARETFSDRTGHPVYLNRGNLDSMGVPDVGRGWNKATWKARLKRNYEEDGEIVDRAPEPAIRGRPQGFQSVPPTLTTLDAMVARALDYNTHPLMEKRAAKERIVNGKEPWNEIVIKNTEDYKLSVCFQGDKAIFVEVYKAIKTVATTPPYPSVKKALATYKVVGARKLNWGIHKSYEVGT